MNHYPESVLVIRFSAVGDIILTSSALETLRAAWPNTRIIFSCKENMTELVAHHPCVDEVVPLSKNEGVRSYAEKLAAANPGAILDLHDKLRSRILRWCYLHGRPKVVWRNRSPLEDLLVNLLLKTYHSDRPIAGRYHLAVERLVGRSLEPGQLRYYPGAEAGAQAAAILKRNGVDLKRPILGVAPGAAWPTKRWTPEGFREIVRRATKAGYQVALNGGPAESLVSRQIAEGLDHVFDFTGVSLSVMGGIIDHCAAFLANDSGAMHMARGLGVPSLSIFGSTDPDMFLWNDAHRFVRVDGLSCSPCSFYGRKKCPRRHLKCLNDISVDVVWEQLQQVMQHKERVFVNG